MQCCFHKHSWKILQCIIKSIHWFDPYKCWNQLVFFCLKTSRNSCLLTSHQKYTVLLPQTQLEKGPHLLYCGSRLTSVDTASNRGLSLDVSSKNMKFCCHNQGWKMSQCVILPLQMLKAAGGFTLALRSLTWQPSHPAITTIPSNSRHEEEGVWGYKWWTFELIYQK